MSSVPDAIEAIKSISSNSLVLPENKQYDEIIKSYFSGLERELKPACFLVPSSVSDTSNIIKALRPFAGNLKLAICGSGQQATPGAANVNDGITIHLRDLRGVHLDTEKRVVSVAAGEQWGNVYETVSAAGLGVVGSRHSSNGIGGDVVQGGISYYSYAHGFVCDTVLNYEVVLASGEIVNANAETNKDLWLALRGGGNNFGIVTRVDLPVFEQGKLWGGKVFYFQPSIDTQIQSIVAYLRDPTPDVGVHICVSLGYASMLGDVMCMNDVFCTRPEEKPKALQPFVEIQPQVDQMRSLRLDSLKGFTDEGFAGAVANRVVKMSTTVRADISILEFAVEIFNKSLGELKGVVENVLFSLTFEPLPVSMLERSAARGGNSSGLKPEDGPLVVLMLYTSWDRASDDERVYEVNRKALDAINHEAEKRHVAASYRYLNYGCPPQDVMGSYGSESQRHMRDVRAKYDSEAFFQTAGVGPFKLSR